MNLTSVRRVKYALGVDSTNQDHIIARLVGAVSIHIAAWLRRRDQAGNSALQLKSREEFISPRPGQRRFYSRAYPIQSITSIYADATGRYTGSESLLSSADYLIDDDLRSVTFETLSLVPDWTGFTPSAKGLRLTYVAGLAPDPVKSTWTGTGGAALTAGKFIQGDDSLAIGRVVSGDSDSIQYECLAGQFQAETVTEYSRLNFSLHDNGPLEPTGNTATLTAVESVSGIPQLSLAESHPALVEACEMQIRFLKANRDNLENTLVSVDSATRSTRSDFQNKYDFMPEIEALLAPYRNYLAAL